MVIQNTYLNLSNIVHTDFELGRVIQTVGSADPGITENVVKMIVKVCELGFRLEADCEDCCGDRLEWLWKCVNLTANLATNLPAKELACDGCKFIKE